MSVTINLYVFIGLCLYAILGTGVFLGVICGASKQAQDNAVIRSLLKADRDHCKKENSVMDIEIKGLVAAREQLEEDLDTSQEHLKARNVKILGLMADKALLVKHYNQSQNVYAWYRTVLRERHPDVYMDVNRFIDEQKKAAERVLADQPAASENDLKPSGTTETEMSESVKSQATEITEIEPVEASIEADQLTFTEQERITKNDAITVEMAAEGENG